MMRGIDLEASGLVTSAGRRKIIGGKKIGAHELNLQNRLDSNWRGRGASASFSIPSPSPLLHGPLSDTASAQI
jgi:hypothetical protein